MQKPIKEVLRDIREGRYTKPEVSRRQLGAPDAYWPNHNPYDLPREQQDWREQDKT